MPITDIANFLFSPTISGLWNTECRFLQHTPPKIGSISAKTLIQGTLCWHHGKARINKSCGGNLLCSSDNSSFKSEGAAKRISEISLVTSCNPKGDVIKHYALAKSDHSLNVLVFVSENADLSYHFVVAIAVLLVIHPTNLQTAPLRVDAVRNCYVTTMIKGSFLCFFGICSIVNPVAINKAQSLLPSHLSSLSFMAQLLSHFGCY